MKCDSIKVRIVIFNYFFPLRSLIHQTHETASRRIDTSVQQTKQNICDVNDFETTSIKPIGVVQATKKANYEETITTKGGKL